MSDSINRTSKGELKAKMFEYLRIVEDTGQPLLVTDRGEPSIIIYRYEAKKSVDEIFGALRKSFKEHNNILESENSEWGELA